MPEDITPESLEKRVELFERAAAFDGRPRERIVAIDEAEQVYYRLYPEHYQILQTVRVASQLGTPSRYKRDPVQQCESRLVRLLMEVILDGVCSGDFRIDHAQKPEELALTTWMLAFGTRVWMDTKIAAGRLGKDHSLQAVCDATETLLDALGFGPVSSEWDYHQTRQIVRDQLFADEWRAVTEAAGTV